MNEKTKYKIGDWCYDNEHTGNDYFWQIRGTSISNGDTVYSVAFMQDTHNSLDFNHWGDTGCIEESKLRPVLKATDLLRCRLSDVQTAYLKARREADQLKADIDALLRSKSLLQNGN